MSKEDIGVEAPEETGNGSHPFSKYLPTLDPGTFPKIHPHAAIFPMISMEEMQALAEDIKTNGLKHDLTGLKLTDPITGRTSDYILDGRNRWVACTMAGVKPVLKDETATLTKQVREDKKLSATLDLVLTENLVRRQLSTVEKALVASRIATARSGGKQDGDVTVAAAAKRIKVSAATIGKVRHLEKAAPEFFAALERKEYPSVDAAYKAAGLNKPPVKVYNVLEVEATERLIIHEETDVRKDGKGFIWKSFKTLEEAKVYVATREAELAAQRAAAPPPPPPPSKKKPTRKPPPPPAPESYEDEDLTACFFTWWRAWIQELHRDDQTCTIERITKLVLHDLLTDFFNQNGNEEVKEFFRVIAQELKKATGVTKDADEDGTTL
jgi:ParB-like chromosome segregation protein Spo0J